MDNTTSPAASLLQIVSFILHTWRVGNVSIQQDIALAKGFRVCTEGTPVLIVDSIEKQHPQLALAVP